MDSIIKHIEGVLITPLSIIEREPGNIMHAMKNIDNGFVGFGEAYFTFVNKGAIKGWKRHHNMVLNLIVPVGVVKFVLYDDREESSTLNKIMEVILSTKEYNRLTVPPGIWTSFSGIEPSSNLVLNIGSILHQPDEADSMPITNNYIPYKWQS